MTCILLAILCFNLGYNTLGVVALVWANISILIRIVIAAANK